MANRVGAAIVGCGNMGKRHARLLSEFEDVHLKTLVDLNETGVRELQQAVGATTVTTDYESVLNDPEVDVVLICTHHHLHAPMCTAAAAAGKHIFCEKPLALTMEDCDRIARAVGTSGIKFMMGFQARFSPFILKLKELIPSPWVTIAQLIDPRWGDQSWANNPVEGGGNVLSQGCHCFDAVRFLNDSPVASIYAEGGNFHHPNLDIIDAVTCTLRFDRGAVANITIGDVGRPALMGKAAYQLFAGETTATLSRYYNEPEMHLWQSGKQPVWLTSTDLPGCRDTHAAHGYNQQMRALVDWIGRDVEPKTAAGIKDGWLATALGIRAIESLRAHQPREIPPYSA